VRYLQLTVDGQPVKTIPIEGACNSYEAERKLFCPCSAPMSPCWLKESHRLAERECDGIFSDREVMSVDMAAIGDVRQTGGGLSIEA